MTGHNKLYFFDTPFRPIDPAPPKWIWALCRHLRAAGACAVRVVHRARVALTAR